MPSNVRIAMVAAVVACVSPAAASPIYGAAHRGHDNQREVHRHHGRDHLGGHYSNESLRGWSHAYPGHYQPVPVPEPASWAIFGLGLLGLGVARRRKRSA
ncbi:PEP-CTERM sorting domain-containing protein [Siccirubricoccus sp. G192]|nr:PEP-CTERM sorting domain-containing protein [Siccirubricoccus sp. G192]